MTVTPQKRWLLSLLATRSTADDEQIRQSIRLIGVCAETDNHSLHAIACSVHAFICTWTPLPLRYCSTHVIALTYPFYHVFTARSTSADKLQRLSIYCVQLHDVFRCMLFSISLGLCAKMWNIKDRPCTAEKGCNVCSVNGVLKKLKSATTSHRTGSGRLHTDSMEANTEGVGELVLSQE